MKKIGGGLIFFAICSIILNYIGIEFLIKGYIVQIIMILVGVILLALNNKKNEVNSEVKNDESKQETCPRCLGKGYVDDLDIKRLKRELEWVAGSCAYCKGVGLVSIQIINNIPVDEAYLTMNLDEESRIKFLNRNSSELRKAAQQKFVINKMSKRIIDLYKNERLSVLEITNILMQEYKFEENETKELEDWVNKVIDLNNQNR